MTIEIVGWVSAASELRLSGPARSTRNPPSQLQFSHAAMARRWWVTRGSGSNQIDRVRATLTHPTDAPMEAVS
jgi:hypothetical protein